MATTSGRNTKFLIFGKGWIAGLLKTLLEQQGEDFTVSDTIRIERREDIERALDEVKPTHVINAAGARGSPNADWCETHQPETILSNVVGAVTVANCCLERGIHVTHFGSGCIYRFDDEHPPIDGEGYLETDPPNFGSTLENGCFYGYSKVVSEMALRAFPNVLILRIRFPIAADLDPKNHLTKILGYHRLVDVPNSGSVLTNLLPGALLLAKHGDTGIYNFTNPGILSNNTILEHFRRIVRPSLTWENFTLEDQRMVLGPRSNCRLDSAKLVERLREYGYEVLHVDVAIEQAFEAMREAGYE